MSTASAPLAGALPLGRLRRGRGILEVPGVALGHVEHADDGRLTGTTVIVPPAGSTAGVDVRGGGPAGHETGVLEPGTHGHGADAIVLTGGSAFGLVTAHGVAAGLLDDGIGFTSPSMAGVTVPIVPAAALFDVGRGGAPLFAPTVDDGRAAYRAASPDQSRLRGSIGAGAGAWTGRGLTRGGLGQAVLTTPAGFTVTAIVAANPMGSILSPDGRLHCASVLSRYGITVPEAPGIAARFAAPDGMPGDGAGTPGSGAGNAGPESAGDDAGAARNTTIAVIVTDATLDAAMTHRLAQSAHAGLARAVHPSHTMLDGDTVFALATGALPLAGDSDSAASAAALAELNIAAADVLSAAIVDAVASAEPYADPDRRTVTGDAPPPPLREVAPELCAAWEAMD